MINAAVFWAVVLSLSMALIQCLVSMNKCMAREQKAVQMMFDAMKGIIDIVEQYEHEQTEEGADESPADELHE